MRNSYHVSRFTFQLHPTIGPRSVDVAFVGGSGGRTGGGATFLGSVR
jgi:hypothetical protein